jgi:hypothetical protein
MKSFLKKFTLLLILLTAGVHTQERYNRKLIVLSIDGFPGYYFDPSSPAYEHIPNLRKLASKSSFSNEVESVYPTLTYPAHTSMITGSTPSIHGIHYNTPLDPFNHLRGDWYWFDEDIKIKTLFDFAKEAGLKTANLYWPVTVGAKIDYNIPQFWRDKNLYDTKFLKSFSTPYLYENLQESTGVSVGEFSGDKEKITTAIQLWKTKKPDVFFIYTTDLDTIHHENGVGSKEAFAKLSEIDKLVGELIKSVQLYKSKNLGLIVVSDHGFKKVENICYPNKFLKDQNTIDYDKKKWNYYFKTLGGTAVLVKNTDKKTKLNSKSINLRELKKEIESNCPGVVADLDGEIFQRAKLELHSELLLILHSTENTVFSDGRSNQYFKTGMSYYNHGFLPEDSHLKTLMIAYPPTNLHLNSIRQTFSIGCNWLQIRCSEGEARKPGD